MLPWIFPGTPLKLNSAPGNIQGNLTALHDADDRITTRQANNRESKLCPRFNTKFVKLVGCALSIPFIITLSKMFCIVRSKSNAHLTIGLLVYDMSYHLCADVFSLLCANLWPLTTIINNRTIVQYSPFWCICIFSQHHAMSG